MDSVNEIDPNDVPYLETREAGRPKRDLVGRDEKRSRRGRLRFHDGEQEHGQAHHIAIADGDGRRLPPVEEGKEQKVQRAIPTPAEQRKHEVPEGVRFERL